MSIFPIFNAFLAGLTLLSIFTWSVSLLWLVLFGVLVSINLYLFESITFNLQYVSGFWLFILSEMAAFGSLLFCCLYFSENYYINLSSPLELPFLGCFILLGSSVTVTAYHHLIDSRFGLISLVLTIILGAGFIVLQLAEMEEIIMNIYDTAFYASSFCTIGLHFSHVLLGVVGLLVTLVVGVEVFSHYRCSIVVWYWHFVDYVWLFVYTFVYVC